MMIPSCSAGASACRRLASGPTIRCRSIPIRDLRITGSSGASLTIVAWERAHAHYLAQFNQFSDVQNERPVPLAALELQVVP